MSGTVPDGWFTYVPYGSPIDETGIIAIKTPLKKAYNNGRARSDCPEFMFDRRVGVPLEDEFTPSQLVLRLQQSALTLGMIVDLTFTDRYYDSSEFECVGVEYVKIKCPGQELPSNEIYSKFQKKLSSFLNDPKNANKLVAVHCTHGLNRTGYLVCRYLIQELKYEAEAAINAFNRCRGYSIERENYLEHLRNGCSAVQTPKKRRSKSPQHTDKGAQASPSSLTSPPSQVPHPTHRHKKKGHDRKGKGPKAPQPQRRNRFEPYNQVNSQHFTERSYYEHHPAGNYFGDQHFQSDYPQSYSDNYHWDGRPSSNWAGGSSSSEVGRGVMGCYYADPRYHQHQSPQVHVQRQISMPTPPRQAHVQQQISLPTPPRQAHVQRQISLPTPPRQMHE